MTDKEYASERRRIKKLLDKWHDTLGMHWFHVEYEWDRERNPKTPAEVMCTEVMWEYREVTIIIRMPACMMLSDDRLEHIVVHEFSHALTGAFMANMDLEDPATRQIMENGTESVANALLWARAAGRRDK